MGWKPGRIPEIVLRPLPLAEVFFMAAQLSRERFLVVELQVSATTAASVSPAIID